MTDAAILARLLDVIADDIVPKTRAGVADGNKIFGAAILRASDLSVVVAEANNEAENPLWHGEMHALKRLYERDRASLPAAKDCIFLSTHEPCSLCLSAITWTGFDRFYFLFSHQESRDAFAIPYDIRILQEVYGGGTDGRPLYRRHNAFWQAHAIREEVDALPAAKAEPLRERIVAIEATYRELSEAYQAKKGAAGIPLA